MNAIDQKIRIVCHRLLFFSILGLASILGACNKTSTLPDATGTNYPPTPLSLVPTSIIIPTTSTFTETPTSINQITPVRTSAPEAVLQTSPTKLPISDLQYFIDLRCPTTQEVLPLVKQGNSWRFSFTGEILPAQDLDDLSLNVVYKRLGSAPTDWIFVYGKGAKPIETGQFMVDGYIGDAKYPPKEGEQVFVSVALVDKKRAPSLDGKVFKELNDLPSVAKSLPVVYNLTLDPSVSSCQSLKSSTFTPKKEYQLAPSCPTGQTRISVDRLTDTWRYLISGRVTPAEEIEDLTVNLLYKRSGKNPTEWIFTSSGGVRPHKNGDFWLSGSIGEPDHPPEPGETFGVILVLTDPVTAKKLDNVNRVSPNLFDGILGFSKPFLVTLASQGEAVFYCQDTPVDATTPAAGIYNLRITCPANDDELTVYPAGNSWTYSLISQVEPASNLQKGDSLFLAYRRFGDANYWAYNPQNDKQRRGTDWILVGKPGNLITTMQSDIAQYQLEGWIGDQNFPPIPGEILSIAVVLMDETKGRSLDTQSFTNLDDIPTMQSYSYPILVHIREAGESESQCQIGSSPAKSTPVTELNLSTSGLDEPMDNFDPFLWEKADGWTNGSPFWVGWLGNHIEFNDGVMSLRLDDQPCAANSSKCSNQPYASGEYRSAENYSYGCYQARFKAASGSGLVSSFFTFFATPEGNYKDQDEIDIEILGKNPRQMQANYFKDGKGAHEKLINLGFDASQDFHDYAFEWSENTIKWFVDGKLVHNVEGTTISLPTRPGQIMMNLWAGKGNEKWHGPFKYPGTPIFAYYDWIRYSPGPCNYVSSNP